jgi:acetyltransferase-like isoleucine patch superfamily enzyme
LLIIVWLANYLRWRALGLRTEPGARGRQIPKIREHVRIENARGVCLGPDVTLRPYSFIRSVPGRVNIGTNTYIGDFTIINACHQVEIGSRATIAPNCHITDANHGFVAGIPIQEQQRVSEPVRIGDDVWLGAGVKVLSGVSIGDGAVVGAGAVVTRDVEPEAIVVGVPAAMIGHRADSSEMLSHALQH